MTCEGTRASNPVPTLRVTALQPKALEMPPKAPVAAYANVRKPRKPAANRAWEWCRLRDSNTRPPHYECDALPTELRRPRAALERPVGPETTHPCRGLQPQFLPVPEFRQNRHFRLKFPAVRGNAALPLGRFPARMGVLVGLHQLAHIDRGVSLGGGERGVTQQFLHAPEIAAAL